MTKSLSILLAVVVGLSPAVILLGLPFHDLGIVPQSEVPAVGLHFAAGLTALLLVLLEMRERGVVAASAGRPVLWLAAIALLGLVLSSFQANPAMMLTGSLEHGVGALWFAETALLTLAASVAMRSGQGAMIVRAAMASVVLVAVGLQILAESTVGVEWQPYAFPEWMGFTLPIAAAALLGQGRAWSAIGLVMLAVGCGWSDNRTAYLVVAAFVAFWAAIRFTPLGQMPKLSLAAGGIATALVALVALLLVREPLEGMASRNVVPDAAVASTQPIDQVALNMKAYGTLWQRSVNMDVALGGMLSHPSSFIVGMGFGGFEQIVSRSGHAAVGRYFEVGPETASRTYWDGDDKASFHSHNLLMDMIIALGLFGGGLWLAFLSSLASSVRKVTAGTCLLVATFTVGGSFWFFVNATAPFLAIAIGSGMQRREIAPAGAQADLRNAGAFLAAVVAMVVSSGYAAVSYATVRGEHSERYFVPAIIGPAGPSCQVFWAIGMPYQQINVWLYEMLVNRVAAKETQAERDEMLKNMAGNFTNFSCVSRLYADAGDKSALETSLRMRARLVSMFGSGNPVLHQAIGPDFRYWGQDLKALMADGGAHEDLVFPYVAFIEKFATRQHLDTVLSDMIEAVGDDSPTGNWLRYRQIVNDGRPGEAKAYIRKAFEGGLANVHPFGRDAIDAATR